MSMFKCKMCGGTLEINEEQSIATCEYCGTKQTLPKLSDDRRTNLYDRANHFRRNNEFDKAMGIYEQILNEDATDAEAYWSLVLCRYGIEYVEDPSTHKRVPTVNRTQFTSIFDDDNYKSALQYADGAQRHLYEQEANTINEIQKGILAISQKEEPFDVFICYKETDNNGRRTQDSVLANDLYHQLTLEGFKVFFSRITLEDKLGTAYEPYIFAALNSAKVMVVLGTKPEYFNAVWVKNEWSRYLALVKASNGKKVLIPAYRDMDPYDLPEEFSHLQAQDMSKLGFMQDLIRGIKKMVQANTPKETVVKQTVVSGGNANTAPLLKRAFMFLEDGDWSSADEYCEKVLDIDPENARAYLGKLMAELQVHKQENLKNQPQPFTGNNNYQKALRFGDEKLKTSLAGDIEFINERNEKARLEGVYNSALSAMRTGTEAAFKEAAEIFESISNYRDSASKAEECHKQAEVARKNAILAAALNQMTGNAIGNYEQALQTLESISGWENADEKAAECKQKIEELKEKAEAARLGKKRKAEIARKKRANAAKLAKRITAITVPSVCVIVAVVLLLNMVIIPYSRYSHALSLAEDGNYAEAIEIFTALEDYKDSETQINECNYNNAINLVNSGNYKEALEIFKALDDYKDSSEQIDSIQSEYQIQIAEVGDYITFGTYEKDNDTSNGKEDIEWQVLEVQEDRILVISQYCLDVQPYNTTDESVTWETCTLRSWLNNDFFIEAFSEEEQAQIPTVTVTAEDDSTYGTGAGHDTQDKVFLLSENEVSEYTCKSTRATTYARAKGARYKTTGNGTLTSGCFWWLRTPGSTQDCAHYMDYYDNIRSAKVASNYIAVRPAMWISIES